MQLKTLTLPLIQKFRQGLTTVRYGLLAVLVCLAVHSADAQNCLECAEPGDITDAPSGDGTVTIRDTDYDPTGGLFVDAVNGDDATGDGTIGKPWKTLKKAITTAPAGAKIVLREGNYREGLYRAIDGTTSLNRSTSFNKKLTLQPYPHEKAWLKGSLDVSTGWTQDGAVWARNWPYQFESDTVRCPRCVNKPNGTYPESSIITASRDMVFINGKSVKQVLRKEQVGPGEFYVDYATDQLYIGDDPAGKLIEATAFEGAFGISGGNPGPADGLVIRGIGFAHFAYSAFYQNARDAVLENNTFAWNAITGVNLTAFNVTFRGNITSYNGRLGIRSGGSNLRLEGNVISYNNIEGFSASWDAAGTKITANTSSVNRGLVVRNNLVENNRAAGIWIDINVLNAVVVNNLTRKNSAFSIFLEISQGGIIAGNTCIENGTGIAVSGTSKAKVYNNTLINNNTNLYVKDTERLNTNATLRSQGFDWESYDNILKNNILYKGKPTREPFAMLDFEQWPCNDDQAMVSELDHNAYYRTDANSPKNVVRYAPAPDDDCTNSGTLGIKFPTLAGFQAAYPQFEQHSIYREGQAQDVFFVNASRGDYRLRSGSPAIRAGAPLPDDVAAALGLPAGVAVDMGAYQTEAPEVPLALAATAVSNTQIDLGWKDNSATEAGFVIEVSEGNASSFAAIDTTAANAVSYSAVNLSGNTTYFFRLKALNAAGSSAYSDPVSATTFPDPPAAALTATVLSQRTISLSWTDNADNEEGYRVETSVAGGTFETVATLAADATAFKHTGLAAGAAYTYRIMGYNRGGETPSNPVTVTTLAAGRGLTGTYYKSKDFNGSSFSRVDATVDFDWGMGAPNPSMSHNTFSVRWQGQLEAVHSETYTFQTVTDDGVRLWVNGKLLIDDWTQRGQRTNAATIALEADKRYEIRMEYYENDSIARAQLRWSSPSQPEQIVPRTQLYASAVTATANKAVTLEWSASLYPNPASEFINLQLNLTEAGLVRITVYNHFNGPVLTVERNVTAQGTLRLPVRHLRAGVYLLKIEKGGQQVFTRLIVKKE